MASVEQQSLKGLDELWNKREEIKEARLTDSTGSGSRETYSAGPTVLLQSRGRGYSVVLIE